MLWLPARRPTCIALAACGHPHDQAEHQAGSGRQPPKRTGYQKFRPRSESGCTGERRVRFPAVAGEFPVQQYMFRCSWPVIALLLQCSKHCGSVGKSNVDGDLHALIGENGSLMTASTATH